MSNNRKRWLRLDEGPRVRMDIFCPSSITQWTGTGCNVCSFLGLTLSETKNIKHLTSDKRRKLCRVQIKYCKGSTDVVLTMLPARHPRSISGCYTYYLQKKAKMVDMEILQGKLFLFCEWNRSYTDDKHHKILRLNH